MGWGLEAVRPINMQLPSPPLLVISDRSQAERPLVEVAAAAFRAGCRWFSLREKDLPAAERRDLLRALVALGRRHGATVTVHDDIEAAVAAGAARLARGPVIALAGIHEHNAAACLAAGAQGIAVMGEIMRAADPEAAVRRLLAAITKK